MSLRRAGRWALLGLVLLAVAVVAHYPHANPLTGETYSYPVHMDEYAHWGDAEAILKQGTITFADPFTGQASGSFNIEENLHERGYQAYIGVLQDATGIPWLALFEWGPVVVALFLALAVYALCEPWGAGVEAAAFVACIPTTLRFLGPGFFVPIVFSLPLVAVGLYFLYHTDDAVGLVFVALLAVALWPIHVIGAFGLFLLGVLNALFVLSTSPRRGAAILVLVGLPFLAAWGFYAQLFTWGFFVKPGLPSSEWVLFLFGAIPLVAATLGAGHLMRHSGRGAFAAGASLAIGMVAIEAVIILRLATGADPLLLYDRSWMLLGLVASILGGMGLAWLRRFSSRLATRVRAGRFGPGIGVALAVGLAGTAIATSGIAQMSQEHYRILDDASYHDYAGVYLNDTYRLALVQGISTMAFTDLAGKPTLYVHSPSDPFFDPPYVQDFFDGGGNDTYFLVQNGVTVVVTSEHLHNPDLVQVNPHVYVLRWDYAGRMKSLDT